MELLSNTSIAIGLILGVLTIESTALACKRQCKRHGGIGFGPKISIVKVVKLRPKVNK